MQQLLSLGMNHTQKLSSTKNSQILTNLTVQKQLQEMYEIRLKSLVEAVKIYQQNLQIDNLNGALAFMKTQQMKTYRIQRQFQLLKDVLLTEKQKLVIKILTSFHEIKKQNDQLKHQSTLQKASFNRNQSENIAEKDQHSKVSIQKESRPTIKAGDRNNNSNSRVSILSQGNQITSSASIFVYQKLLQQKLTMIKQLQKKNKQLLIQNQDHLQKIMCLNTQMQKSAQQESVKRICLQCISFREINSQLNIRMDISVAENEKYKMKMRQLEFIKNSKEEQIKLKDLKLKQLQMEIQVMNKQNELLTKQIKLQQQQKVNKPNPQANIQTIKQLKQKLIVQQQQLMSITNSFQFLKQDIGDTLISQIKRLKNSHQLLKQSIKSSIMSMKKQMTSWVCQIVEYIKIKSVNNGNSNKKYQNDIVKKLRQIDNQIDYFIEQRHIKL